MLSRLLHIFDNSIGNVHTNSNCSSLIWFGFMHNVPDSSYGPGGTLIFSYIRRLGLRLGSFFVVQILNFIIFYIFFRGGGGQKNEYFLVFIFFGYFWWSSQNWTIFRGHFYAFYGLFLRSRYRIGDTFWSCKNLKYFLRGGGGLKFLIFWRWEVNGRCWARAYV